VEQGVAHQVDLQPVIQMLNENEFQLWRMMYVEDAGITHQVDVCV
jgi:hypothetical protein